MSYFKYLLLIAVIFSASVANAQSIYEVSPDFNNCTPGKLTQETKDQIIELVNDIRARHKIAPIAWNEEMAVRAQAAALSIVATGVVGHEPVSGKCSDATSDAGRAESNLMYMMGYLPTNVTFENIKADIIGWLIDANNAGEMHTVGHRRLIFNPFTASFAYGVAYGDVSQCKYSSTFWGISNDNAQSSVCENDFVAYPYENYPIAWVDKEFYLSFNPIIDPNTYYPFNDCDLSNAKITMKDEQGNNIAVNDINYDYVGWGLLRNNVSWKASNLKDSVKYDVTISGIMVDKIEKTYNYWFKLTDEPTLPPTPLASIPTLVAPTNNATNVEITPIEFKWNNSENAVSYHIIGSSNSNFTDTAFEANNLTDTVFTLTEELSNDVTYYWKVEAYNVEDAASDYSEVWQFTTIETIPEPPVATYPLADMETIALRDNYTWQKIEGASSYNLQISTLENFATLTVNQTDIYDTTYYLAAGQSLNEFTDYYWRVKAILVSGNETNWSKPIKYKTNDTPNEIVEEISGFVVSCYPNPFSEYANITIEATQLNKVKIEIYDLLGMKVASLHDDIIGEGKHNFIFEPTTGNEIYFCKVQIGDNAKIIQLNFVKD